MPWPEPTTCWRAPMRRRRWTRASTPDSRESPSAWRRCIAPAARRASAKGPCAARTGSSRRPARTGAASRGLSGSLDQASSDIISGAAGIGLTLLWAHDALDHPDALEAAAGAGRRLVGLGEEAPGGLRWLVSLGYPRNYPNFSHGTAGVAYFLARLHAATGEAEPLEAAVRGAHYLEAVGRCDEDGCAVFHHEPGGEDLYYLSWCHGPVGTARLFEALARATGDSRWRGWIPRGAAAIQAYGVPERRSPGYWNNVSQCCGDAGVGEFFLALEEAAGDDSHGAYAERVGRWLLDQSSEDAGGRRWVQAENRVSPDEVAAQTGRMQGAAGVGTFLLHLDGRRAGRRPTVVLPDSPWWG